jgi:hypothetical protein
MSEDDNNGDEPTLRGQVERLRQPFVPDPKRVVPVDPVRSAHWAARKFEYEIPIMVGAQLTERIVDESGDLEDTIRERARDGAHYNLMEQVHVSFVAKAVQIRDRFMDGDDDPRYR